MEITGTATKLNEKISHDVKEEIYLLFCNSNFGKNKEKQIVDIINKSFTEGKQTNRNEKVDSI
jgi:hypothetical protein